MTSTLADTVTKVRHGLAVSGMEQTVSIAAYSKSL